MKTYIKFLIWFRKILCWTSFLIGGIILVGYDYMPALLPISLESFLWKANSLAIFILMIIRPLADLLPSQKWLKALIPLRKELGIFSAMIVLSFGVAKYIYWGPSEFLATYFSLSYWPFPQAVFWGRVGELVAIPLLLTSNLYSQKKLKKHWKRIQKLTYVYFFAGAYYVYEAFGATEELWFMGIVVGLTVWAFLAKKYKAKK